MSIYVGNLSYEVTQEDLNGVFAEYGSVKRVQLPTDRETGRVRGFGFVEVPDDAVRAVIAALHGTKFHGRDLKVNESEPHPTKKDKSWKDKDRINYEDIYGE